MYEHRSSSCGLRPPERALYSSGSAASPPCANGFDDGLRFSSNVELLFGSLFFQFLSNSSDYLLPTFSTKQTFCISHQEPPNLQRVRVTGRPAGGRGGLFYSFSCLSARLPATILSAPLSPKSFEPPHHRRSIFSHKLCKSSQLSQLIIDNPSHKCPPPLILPTPPYNASLSLLLPSLMLTAPSFNPSNHSKRSCKRLLQQNSEPLIKCAGSARVGQRFE
jgi:hypothetical protein